MLIDIIAGARPNFVKIAPIIKEIDRRILEGSRLRYRLVHTGQHYDQRMSGDFFQQLGIPSPDINLDVGSGSQAEQTAAIMVRYEKLLTNSPSKICLVVGDVNSTMACAITAQKMGIPVAHVEAGIRSNDWSMPEEINRLVTDSISNWFFTTSEYASNNLMRSGVEKDRIFFVGNTMIDTLISNMDKLRKPDFFEPLGLQSGEYFVVTLHRPHNVDSSSGVESLLRLISQGVDDWSAIFPVHPRTAKIINEIKDLPNNIHIVEPQPYLEFNYLVKHAKGVVTDSGGITEEATVMGVPCITLRDTTERPETVDVGTNELAGSNSEKFLSLMSQVVSGKWKEGSIPEKWDGNTSRRIVSKIESLLSIDK